MSDFYEAFRATVPEGECDGLEIMKFDTREGQWKLDNLRYAMQGRGTAPGIYTMMKTKSTLWMSDTNAEARDHRQPYYKAKELGAKRVLINGLGLGCILNAILSLDTVEHVDVVEFDPRVIKLVAPTYANDPRVNIIEADAYVQAKNWPVGTHWDVAWHDIWPNINEDNLPEMARLHRSYGRRVTWQGSWAKDILESERRRTVSAPRRFY